MSKLRIAIAGAGSRGQGCYGKMLLEMQDRAQVVAVADLRPERLKAAADAHGVAPENRFETVEEMLSRPQLADAVLVCTQDRQHVGHAVMALKKGNMYCLKSPYLPMRRS